MGRGDSNAPKLGRRGVELSKLTFEILSWNKKRSLRVGALVSQRIEEFGQEFGHCAS